MLTLPPFFICQHNFKPHVICFRPPLDLTAPLTFEICEKHLAFNRGETANRPWDEHQLAALTNWNTLHQVRNTCCVCVWLCVVVCVLCGCVCGCVVVCVCACLWLSSLTCLCLPPPLTFLLFHFVILQEPATLGPNHCEQEHAQRDSQQEVQGEDDNTHASVH